MLGLQKSSLVPVLFPWRLWVDVVCGTSVAVGRAPPLSAEVAGGERGGSPVPASQELWEHSHAFPVSCGVVRTASAMLRKEGQRKSPAKHVQFLLPSTSWREELEWERKQAAAAQLSAPGETDWAPVLVESGQLDGDDQPPIRSSWRKRLVARLRGRRNPTRVMPASLEHQSPQCTPLDLCDVEKMEGAGAGLSPPGDLSPDSLCALEEHGQTGKDDRPPLRRRWWRRILASLCGWNRSSGAKAEPVAGAAAEPLAEPLAEAAAEPLAEPLAEAAAEPLAEPLAEAAAEPLAERKSLFTVPKVMLQYE
ncbi:uncharacterized protein VSU04_012228 [Chlamydotis macqueenii]